MSDVLEKVELGQLNTFKVSAKANFFLEVDSISAIQDSLAAIQSHNKRMVLGGGSNILFTSDYDGLIIFPKIYGIEIVEENESTIRVSVGASENWHYFVENCCDNGWHGLENLALIPGTVGASPVQNIGAYGVEVKDFIHQVECVNLVTGKKEIFKNSQCQFAYRDSVFKQSAPGTFIITRVEFNLNKEPDLCLEYQPLNSFFAGNNSVTPRDVLDKVCQVRSEKLPDPDNIPNAGSFFKNPVVTRQQYGDLIREYPDMVAFPVGKEFKLAAGWLIEKAGFKGFTEGEVGVHKNQALVLVNYSAISGAKIWQLAQKIHQEIKRLFNVDLEVEVRVIGNEC